MSYTVPAPSYFISRPNSVAAADILDRKSGVMLGEGLHLNDVVELNIPCSLMKIDDYHDI